MDNISMLRRTVGVLDGLVGDVTDKQLGAQTPCEDWKVRDLLNHLVGGATMFAVSAEQGSVPDDQLGQLMGGDNLGADFRGAWKTASQKVLAAFDDPKLLDKQVTLPFGSMSAGAALDMAVFDVATHACDLAKATGQTVDDDALLEAAIETGKRVVPPEWRGTPFFGLEQPCAADAPASERLLAFGGRKP